MTEKVLYIIAGMFLGAIFQNDIPIFKDMNHQQIRSHLVALVSAVTVGNPEIPTTEGVELKDISEEPTADASKRPKRTRKETKRIRLKELEF